RVHHGPFDADVIEKIQPAFGADHRALIALRRSLDRAARVHVIEGRKTDALAPDDVAVSAFHMRDDAGVIFHNMTVAVDDSGSKLGRHFQLPPNRPRVFSRFSLRSFLYNLTCSGGSSATLFYAPPRFALVFWSNMDTVSLIFL